MYYDVSTCLPSWPAPIPCGSMQPGNNEEVQTNGRFPRRMLSIYGHETFHRYSEGKGQTSQLHLASSNNPLDVPLRTWTPGDDSDSNPQNWLVKY